MKQARRELEQLQGVYESRVNIKTCVLEGAVAQVICEVAQRESMDAIILCSHGRAGLAHIAIGSVAERVTQDAHCPVLLIKIPKDAAGQFVMLRVEHKLNEILVGYDHREGSGQALASALDLVRGRSARITLLHALEPPPPTPDNMDPVVDASLIEKAKSWLRSVIERHTMPGVDWRMVVEGGHPWKLLIDTAKELRSDLIVVGPHDHTGWRHCFIGSTAQRVARLAPCSVLAIK
jgi:nucleotide-binding universal stress UspA family protein